MEEQGKGKNKLEWTLEKVFGFENKMSIGVLGLFFFSLSWPTHLPWPHCARSFIHGELKDYLIQGFICQGWKAIISAY